MKKVTCILLVLLSFGTIAGQTCTWSFDTNELHISDVQSTNDQNELLISINDDTKKERTVLFNIRNQTFREASNVTIESFNINDHFTSYASNYNLMNKTNGENGTEFILNSKLGNNIFVKRINDTIESLTGYLVSEKLKVFYLLAKFTSEKDQVKLLTTGLDNETPMITRFYNDVIGSWGINPDNYWEIDEEKQLLFMPAGCCYCVNGYYFRYNETTLYHVFTENTVAQHNLFDPRSNEFQTITYSGKITIYNYELDIYQGFTIHLSEIDPFLNKTNVDFPGTLALLGIMIITLVLVKGRKEKN